MTVNELKRELDRMIILGHGEADVLITNNRFPGYGDETIDCTLGTKFIDSEWTVLIRSATIDNIELV